MKRKSRTKPITKMNVEELTDATAEFDSEFAIDTFDPLSAEGNRRWQKAKGKRGRPQQGRGAKVISVTVEATLLSESDKLAKKLGVSRAALIARGLRAVLAAEEIT